MRRDLGLGPMQQRGLDIGGGDRRTVRELEPLAQRHHEGLLVGGVDAFGQRILQLVLGVERDEPAMDQREDEEVGSAQVAVGGNPRRLVRHAHAQHLLGRHVRRCLGHRRSRAEQHRYAGQEPCQHGAEARPAVPDHSGWSIRHLCLPVHACPRNGGKATSCRTCCAASAAWLRLNADFAIATDAALASVGLYSNPTSPP